MTASEPDDVDLLLAQLKMLPLIDTADLDAEFAAYDAFELLLGAVLRAALVQVPPAERYDNNGELFKRFVVERFPAGRGLGNTDYASKLWKFRNAVVKNKQTGPFLLIHNTPAKHWKIERGARVLDLQSLVADYREAVDNLAPLLRSSLEMKALATAELAGRTVRLVTIAM
jgi:hypothetical protein